MTKAAVSWSGGKDCTLACYRALKSGLDVHYLLNMSHEDSSMSWTHGLQSRWLEMQAQAMGMVLVQGKTSGTEYENEFKKQLKILKQEGVTTGIFGDIDFAPHLEWVTRVCRESGVEALLPLWGIDQNQLLKEFIDAGFEAIIVATQADLMGEEWLGRKIDNCFIDDLMQYNRTREKKITPCGEAGEYHTIVVNGPLFRQHIEIVKSEHVNKDGYWFLHAIECVIRPNSGV
jgi:diphthine-ammonia ligase